MRLPPLPMRPFFVEKIWGGSRLASLPAKQRAGHQPPKDKAIGESWEVSDLPEGESVVDDASCCGSFSGRSLGSMVREFGHDLVGTSNEPTRFPVLVKLLDAAEDLSVQVHPGPDYAAAHPGTFSKEEAWLVVDSAKGGRVLHGFVDGVTKNLFKDALKMGLPHELMRSVEVQRGDVLHVSPGIVHAIGAGVVILEVQEPSDTTFRLWDFGRKDSSGKERPLHLEQAMAVARFTEQPPALSQKAKGDGMLVETKRFNMRALEVNGAKEVVLDVNPQKALALHAEDGSVCFSWDAHPIELPRGASCVLPATCGRVTFPAQQRPAHLIVMS